MDFKYLRLTSNSYCARQKMAPKWKSFGLENVKFPRASEGGGVKENNWALLNGATPETLNYAK